MDLPESPRPRMLWITDPWDTLDHPHDTTLRFIEEAVRLGVGAHWADVHSIRWEGHTTQVDVFEVVAVDRARAAQSFVRVARGSERASHFDCLLYRPDPPVDLAYLHPLQLLALDCERASDAGLRCRIVNPPRLLFGQSEKLVGGSLAERMPPTVVATQWERLCAFGVREGRAIAKPMHLCQSRGVELLDFRTGAGRERSRRVLEDLTGGFTRPAVLQRFLPEVVEGETRIWFVDGSVLGVVRKKSADGSYRIDMDKGGTLTPHVLTAREQSVVPSVGTWLQANGVRLAAIDLVDGWITDFNFTSPGLLANMERVLECNLAGPVIEALARTEPRAPCVRLSSGGREMFATCPSC